VQDAVSGAALFAFAKLLQRRRALVLKDLFEELVRLVANARRRTVIRLSAT
jgi:hypothetical protein